MIIRDISDRKAAEHKLSQTSTELQHSLNDFKKIMDSSLDVICTVDESGKFIKVSAASKSIWGYEPDEIIGQNYEHLLFKEDVELSLAK